MKRKSRCRQHVVDYIKFIEDLNRVAERRMKKVTGYNLLRMCTDSCVNVVNS